MKTNSTWNIGRFVDVSFANQHIILQIVGFLQKTEQFAKLEFLNDKIDQKTSFAKFKELNGHFCTSLHGNYDYSSLS